MRETFTAANIQSHLIGYERLLALEELIKEILKADGYEDSVDIDNVDWSCLLNNQEPEIEKTEEEESDTRDS